MRATKKPALTRANKKAPKKIGKRPRGRVRKNTPKRSEEETRRARDYAEAMLRFAPFPLLILDSELRITSANEAFHELFKIGAGDATGQLIYELGNRAWDIPRLRYLLEDIVPQNSFFNGFEVTGNFDKIGERKMVLSARRVRSPNDNILLAMIDVTEILHLENEVRRSELRYRRLFESARDGILILDQATEKIMDANPFMTELLGYTHNELVGRELHQIGMLKDKEASLKAFHELREKNFIRCDNVPLKTKSGRALQIELVGNRYSEDGRHLIQCNIRDVTVRRGNEKQLREAQTLLAGRAAQLEEAVRQRTVELSDANDQLNTFVYTIAHDLRAPLRSMEGFSSMLTMEEGLLLTETGRDYANRIGRSARYMDELLTDLLAFSRLNQERIELVPVNLEKVVRASLGRLEAEIQEKNAQVEVSGPWPGVMAYEPVLGQLFFNLLNNALKFVVPDITPQVKLWAEDRGKTIRIWIRDNGIGIMPEHHEQIFRVFTRLHGDKFPGTGIGLAIVQKGMERMNGRVGLESAPGEGSKFWLELRKP